MQSELPLVPGRGLSTRTATELRQAFMREHGIIHDAIGNHHLDTQSIQNNIESFVGSTEIPIGLVGPIVFNQNDIQEFVYAPVGTLEGALVASADRGAARHRTAAGQPAGCPTREEKGVRYMHKNMESKSEICKNGIRHR